MIRWMTKQHGFLAVVLSLAVATGWGCAQSSYPADHLEEAIQKICKTEYGIDEVVVRIVENTLGVYLPLDKLFVADFKEMAAKGEANNIDSLFEPSEAAMEKVEDVLFTISRVVLSTDRNLQFYTLEATDTKNTGLQLVLSGHVNDIKRVRIWDISRSEYRKRVVNELRMNQAVIWHKSVRKFFKSLEPYSINPNYRKYLGPEMPLETVQQVFYDVLANDITPSAIQNWRIQDIRSTEWTRNNVVVYTRVIPEGDFELAEDFSLEYLFVVSFHGTTGQINRILPFQYRNSFDQLEKIDFPKELEIEQNLSQWRSEFDPEPIHLGAFLSVQATRRAQHLLASDERIRNTVRDAKIEFRYVEDTEPAHFTLDLDVRLKDYQNFKKEAFILHEDMSYLLDIVSREFMNVVRGYHFGEYDYLELNVIQDPNPWILGRQELELYRRNKVDMQTLLSSF